MSKKSRFEKSLEELPEDIILNFKKRKWTIQGLILYLLKENRRLSKSQRVPSWNCHNEYIDQARP